MSTTIQLYALKKDSFNQTVHLASLNRGLKYMAVIVQQVVFCFHLGISCAMFLLHISVFGQQNRGLVCSF